MSLNFAHIHEQLFNAKFRAILISWVILAIILRNENLNFLAFSKCVTKSNIKHKGR